MDFYEIKKKIVREFENKGYVNKKINQIINKEIEVPSK